MDKYFKHPIVLALIVGLVVYVLMSYFYNNSTAKIGNKKSKKDKKNKSTGFFTDKRETVILVSAIAALGTWFLAKTYLTDNTVSNNNMSVDINGFNNSLAPNLNQMNAVPGSNDLNNLMSDQMPIDNFMQNNNMSFQAGGSADLNNTQFSHLQNQQNPQMQNMQNIQQMQQIQQNPQMQQNSQNIQQMRQASNNMNPTMNSTMNPNINQIHQMQNKSYNLLGSGVDIPRTAIPSVLVDYE